MNKKSRTKKKRGQQNSSRPSNSKAKLTKRVRRRYVPESLSKKDRVKQEHLIRKSQIDYKRGIYNIRPKVKSFHSKESKHIRKAKKMFGISSLSDFKTLSEKTHCHPKAFEEILNKGRGAFYSSGSRPNQTADSWAYARLASALTGGPASLVDSNILEKYCDKKK